MILYVDTSALVKVYLDEPHSDWVRERVAEASVLATSVVAYPEAVAAVTRRAREGDLSEELLERVVAALESDWGKLLRVNVDEKRAGALARSHGIRGFDAIHLAASLEVAGAREEVSVCFSSFDRRLNRAAREEGLLLAVPSEYVPGG